MFLTPLSKKELYQIFDKNSLKVLKYLSNKAFFAQPELAEGQDSLPIHIPKEHIEQWIIQAIGGKPVGSGNYPIDIVYQHENKIYGFDIVMVSASVDDNNNLTNSQSGETSLAQYFQNINGESLDNLFENEKYQIITDHWANIFHQKYLTAKKDYGITDAWLLIVFRAGENLYLGGLEADFTKQPNLVIDKTTKTSIFVKGIIDSEYGNTKIYRSKKRLELRLKSLNWLKNNLLIKINENFVIPTTNLKKLIETNKLNEYSIEQLKKLGLID